MTKNTKNTKKVEVETIENEVPFSGVTDAMLAAAANLGSVSVAVDGKVAKVREDAAKAEQHAWGQLLTETVAFGRELSRTFNGEISDSDKRKLRAAILDARIQAMQKRDPSLEDRKAQQRANPGVTNIMQILTGIIEGKEIPDGEANLQVIARMWANEAKEAALANALAEAGEDSEKAAEIKAKFEAEQAKAGGRPKGTVKTETDPEGYTITPDTFKGIKGVTKVQREELCGMLLQIDDKAKFDQLSGYLAFMVGVKDDAKAA